MKIGNTRTICKKGKHGMTKHAIYSYGKTISIQCLECAKEKKALRQADKEKYESDKAYTRQWSKDNREKLSADAHAKRQKEKQERKKRINNYLNAQKSEIKNILVILESPLTFEDIKKHCLHFNTSSINHIKRFIINNKKSQLLDRETYMQSYVVKRLWGVTGNGFNFYSDLSEDEKEQIRKEYKARGRQRADKKIAALCSKLV